MLAEISDLHSEFDTPILHECIYFRPTRPHQNKIGYK